MFKLLIVIALIFALLAAFGHSIKQSEGAPFLKRYVIAPAMLSALIVCCIADELYHKITKKHLFKF